MPETGYTGLSVTEDCFTHTGWVLVMLIHRLPSKKKSSTDQQCPVLPGPVMISGLLVTSYREIHSVTSPGEMPVTQPMGPAINCYRNKLVT